MTYKLLKHTVMLNSAAYFPSSLHSIWHAHAPVLVTHHPHGANHDNPIFWHSKPDYVTLLAEKFGADLGDDCAENAPDLLKRSNVANPAVLPSSQHRGIAREAGAGNSHHEVAGEQD